MTSKQNLINNWQQHLKNWSDRISYIKDKETLTDFRFIVGPDKTVFHANKLIFAISSPEFENLFYLNQTDMEEIELPDNSLEAFKDFINFIYTGVLNLTSENVEEIMKLAKLYTITILAGLCESFFRENIGRCLRFHNGPDPNRGMSLKGKENFNVCVNKNIFFLGFGVFGRQIGALKNYAFTITLKNDVGTVLVNILENFTCDGSGTTDIYEIFFENPVLLEQFKMYNIEDCRDGPRGVYKSYRGKDGKVEMEKYGVIFKISKASPIEEIHPLTNGRIASFIFRCC